jgi:hypothetical protein
MKYVSIRKPEPGPFGETLFEAKALAIALALLVNNPRGGWVESVFTFAIQSVFLILVEPQDCRSHKGDAHNRIQFRFRQRRHLCTARYSTCHPRERQPDTGKMGARIPAQYC